MARLPYVIPYDPAFLGDGFEVPHPKTCCGGKLLNGGEVIDYIHFSLVMHRDRRSALYTAHNVDISQKRSADRTSWDLDLRIGAQHQIGNEAYRNNNWDRGHLVRRSAVAWGSSQQEAQDASDSTFYYPVAALQHETFNQSSSKWLGLEDWILQKAGSFATRLCVFTGPIYTEFDKEERGFKIPSAFWKIVVLRDPTSAGQDLAALGFIMKQNESWRKVGRRALTNLEPFHVSIAEIEAYTGLRFGSIGQLDEFDWRQVRFRARSMMPPIPINGPDDIVFSGDRRRARGIRALRKFSAGAELPAAIAKVDKPGARSVEQKPCGCKDHRMDLEQEIKALKAQTTALCEIVESLVGSEDRNINDRSMGNLRSTLARIIGGEIVQPGEFEECVAIGNDVDGYFCSGILVHEKLVLTAAHCSELPMTKVFLKGRQVSTELGAEIRKVAEVILHPDYDLTQIPQHDIAVLVLKEASKVAPAILASRAEVLADDSLILVGFGSDSPDGLTGFGTKRKVNVARTNTSGFSENEMLQIQQEHGFAVTHEFHGGDIRSGRDTCNGDSGGPAYIDMGGMRKVAGLTSRAAESFIDPCGDGGIYTMIAAYLPWLHEVTGGLVGQEDNQVDEPEENEESIDEPSSVVASALYVSAALPNPAGPDPGNEWVEVANDGESPVDLQSYRIEDKQGGRLELTGEISAGGKSRFLIPEGHPIKLANSGDQIKLLLDGLSIHEVSYPRVGSGQIVNFQSPYGNAKPEHQHSPKEDCNCDDNIEDCGRPIDPEFTPGAIPC